MAAQAVIEVGAIVVAAIPTGGVLGGALAVGRGIPILGRLGAAVGKRIPLINRLGTARAFGSAKEMRHLANVDDAVKVFEKKEKR